MLLYFLGHWCYASLTRRHSATGVCMYLYYVLSHLPTHMLSPQHCQVLVKHVLCGMNWSVLAIGHQSLKPTMLADLRPFVPIHYYNEARSKAANPGDACTVTQQLNLTFLHAISAVHFPRWTKAFLNSAGDRPAFMRKTRFVLVRSGKVIGIGIECQSWSWADELHNLPASLKGLIRLAHSYPGSIYSPSAFVNSFSKFPRKPQLMKFIDFHNSSSFKVKWDFTHFGNFTYFLGDDFWERWISGLGIGARLDVVDKTLSHVKLYPIIAHWPHSLGYVRCKVNKVYFEA